MRILLPLFLAFLLSTSTACAEGERLPGKVVLVSDRIEGSRGIYTFINGKVKKIYEQGGSAKWSPDGRKILLARRDPEFNGLVVMDQDGRNEIRYPTSAGPKRCDWLNDHEVIFSSGPSTEQEIKGEKVTEDFYRYNFEGKSEQKISSFNDYKALTKFSLSPDRKRIFFTRYFSESGLEFESRAWESYISNSDLTEIQKLNIQALDPSWAPSGDQILYTSGYHEGNRLSGGVLSLYDIKAKKEHILIDENEKKIIIDTPQFSSDGKKILFSLWSGLYTTDADGSNLKAVLPPKKMDTSVSSEADPNWWTPKK